MYVYIYIYIYLDIVATGLVVKSLVTCKSIILSHLV